MQLWNTWISGFLLLALAAGAAFAADNVLTPEEKKAGWILLFDGSTLRNCRNPATKDQPRDAWVIEAGALKSRVHPRIEEDLVTEASFRDFELVFDWRVAPGGDTGVKYHVQHLIFIDQTKARRGPNGYVGSMERALHDRSMSRSKLAPGATAHVYTVAFEMQLIDDERSPDGKKGPKYGTGSLYGMIAAEPAPVHPAGEWNSGRLVVKGDHIEHWVNGVKVLDGSLASPEVREGALARWKDGARHSQDADAPQAKRAHRAPAPRRGGLVPQPQSAPPVAARERPLSHEPGALDAVAHFIVQMLALAPVRCAS